MTDTKDLSNSAVRFHDGRVVLYGGDCLDILDTLPENSIDAVVTDPPYELGFMGKSWDASGIAFCPDTWRLIWRVLKPGGTVLDPFAGSGTTGQASLNEGFNAILIEREEEYRSDIARRISGVNDENI